MLPKLFHRFSYVIVKNISINIKAVPIIQKRGKNRNYHLKGNT